MSPPRSGVTEHAAAHLSRTRHPAPWARQPTRLLQPPPEVRDPRPPPIPVFVDESGRRRRVGRLLGCCLGALVLGYVAVVALTFAGVPLVGKLAPPGVSQLAQPAGDAGVTIGLGAQESVLPPAASVESSSAGPAATTTTATEPVASTTTTSAPSSTTTTAPPGQGATTSVPAPASTVPDHTVPTGPPTDPPGRP